MWTQRSCFTRMVSSEMILLLFTCCNVLYSLMQPQSSPVLDSYTRTQKCAAPVFSFKNCLKQTFVVIYFDDIQVHSSWSLPATTTNYALIYIIHILGHFTVSVYSLLVWIYDPVSFTENKQDKSQLGFCTRVLVEQDLVFLHAVSFQYKLVPSLF